MFHNSSFPSLTSNKTWCLEWGWGTKCIAWLYFTCFSQGLGWQRFLLFIFQISSILAPVKSTGNQAENVWPSYNLALLHQLNKSACTNPILRRFPLSSGTSNLNYKVLSHCMQKQCWSMHFNENTKRSSIHPCL